MEILTITEIVNTKTYLNAYFLRGKFGQSKKRLYLCTVKQTENVLPRAKESFLMQGRTKRFDNERKATSALGSAKIPTSMIWKYYLLKVTFAEGGLNYDVH